MLLVKLGLTLAGPAATRIRGGKLFDARTGRRADQRLDITAHVVETCAHFSSIAAK